jgi:DNA-binding NarL/FixJ family response regulator
VSGKQIAKTRILVADEHPLLRHGVVAFINGQPDMIACGEADCISSIRAKLAETKPHLLVIGLRLGAGDCLEFVKGLKAQNPGLLILVYSMFEETIFAERALRAGANGYLMKKAMKEELLTAIRDRPDSCQPGFGPACIPKIHRNNAANRRSRTTRHRRFVRSRDACFSVDRFGAGHKQDCALIEPERETIETHRENIKRKLGLTSGRQLVERAIKFVEENFLPPKGETAAGRKKKVVPFRAA